MNRQTARIAEIDIGRQAKVLSILRLTDYPLVILCGFWAVELLSKLAIIGGEDIATTVFLLIAAAILLLAAYTGWRHVGVIDPRVWRAYLFVLPLLFLFCLLVGLSIAFGQDWNSKSILDSGELLVGMMNALWVAAVALPGLVCVALLRRTRIAPMGIGLAELLARLGRHSGPSGPALAGVARINPRRGVVIGAAGAAMLLGVIVIPQLVDLPSWPRNILVRDSWKIQMFGFALLVRARRYFQVSADALQAVDRRPPVLFLRSFEDDEKQKYRGPSRGLLDFSLEMRLANHFHRLGPFIAIGSPKEPVPILGAARVLLPDDQWQARVLGWMRDAHLIVMYSGKTQWVNWELRNIIENGRATQLILLIPEIKGWRSGKRAQDLEARVTRIREVFKDTPWHEELLAWRDFAGLRAMLFRADGSMVMVKSKSRTRDSYHLAALVAHFVLLDQVALPDAPTAYNHYGNN